MTLVDLQSPPLNRRLVLEKGLLLMIFLHSLHLPQGMVLLLQDTFSFLMSMQTTKFLMFLALRKATLGGDWKIVLSFTSFCKTGKCFFKMAGSCLKTGCQSVTKMTWESSDFLVCPLRGHRGKAHKLGTMSVLALFHSNLSWLENSSTAYHAQDNRIC